MYECFHCCKRAVIWDTDFDFSDFGLEETVNNENNTTKF